MDLLQQRTLALSVHHDLCVLTATIRVKGLLGVHVQLHGTHARAAVFCEDRVAWPISDVASSVLEDSFGQRGRKNQLVDVDVLCTAGTAESVWSEQRTELRTHLREVHILHSISSFDHFPAVRAHARCPRGGGAGRRLRHGMACCVRKSLDMRLGPTIKHHRSSSNFDELVP